MNSLYKTIFREIKQSLGRYLAIFAIVALGVGFFGGLKVTKPAMIKTLDAFINEKNLFDFRLLSTIGFEEEDLEKLTEIPEVTAIEEAWNVDALCDVKIDAGESNERAYRIHSITDSVNGLLITEGRLPENDNECVIDNYMESIPLGSKVCITYNNEQDTLDMLKNHELTVVGAVRTPYYINFERGNTSIGNGKITGFIYVPKGEFDVDYIGEIFITMDNGNRYGAYTKQYDDYIDLKKSVVEDTVKEVVFDRYDRIVSEAEEKIADAENELSDKQKEAEDELSKAKKDIEKGEKEISDNEKLLADGQSEIDKAKSQIKNNESTLQKSKQELLEKKTLLESSQMLMSPLEYEMGMTQIKEGEAQIESGLAQIKKAKAEISSKEQEINDGIVEIEKAKKELEDGKKEYADGVKELDEKLAEGRDKIADAKKELEDLKEPDYFVLGRDTNIGYVCYESDTDIVASIANVFPVFFLLIAVLICMTTMNRMVEEQRTQIGIMKALGYSSASIMMKYVFYAGSAALLGAVIGYTAGTRLLPQMIFQAYNIMYNMGSTILYKSVTWVAVGSIAAALLCSVGAAYFSVIYELKDAPANLIRPKAPRSGKRIFLEYIDPVWKRLPFLHKVSARNIFRYKKRFLMMVLGIGGCTALVLTGFGIGNSIKGVADLQYENVQVYDISVAFSEDATLSDINAITDEKAVFMEKTVDLSVNGSTKQCYLDVPENEAEFSSFLNLIDSESGEEISYPNVAGKAVITKSITEKMNIKVGDTVTVTDSDMNSFNVVISGICENYVSSYLYITKETYENALGDPKYNTAWVRLSENEDAHELSAKYMNYDNVLSVSVIKDLQNRISTMMKGMDFIVVVVIMCAGALAFIVLYNLTNINITERIREIATIKVLGFYASETAQYVFRENMVLTMIGAILGLPLGKALHTFIMHRINIDMISFRNYIAPISYLYAIVLTFVFAMIVNGIMYFKIRDINMAESLKGVE